MAENSYKQILKSTSIVGGAQGLNIIVNIFKTKIIAILLGSEGVGILGILQSIIDMIRSATSFGINFSAVKDIAEAAESSEYSRINKVVYVVRRWSFATGILGLIIGIVFCIPLSNYAFSSNNYAVDIALISFSILLTSISAGQLALLQGLRRIGKMAKAIFYGTLVGTIVSLPLYYFLGKDGIVPGILLVSCASLMVSWLYTKDIRVKDIQINILQTFKAGLGMMRTGFFIVISGFGVALTLYAIRALIVDKMSAETVPVPMNECLAAVGMFQGAWTISKTYVGILTNAMLADYFPRLSAVNENREKFNKIINEQIEMTLLIGVPLIIGMILFAPLVIRILYSESFIPVVNVLQWQMVANFLTLISWPLGVIFLSKGRGEFCVVNDLLWCVFIYLFVYWGWSLWGFNSLGIVFPFASLLSLILILSEARILSRFRFTKRNIRLIFLFAPIAILSFLNVLFFDGLILYAIGGVLFLFVCLYSIRSLNKVINFKDLFSNFRK